MEGKPVADPSQLMDTTIEVLRRGKCCYRCFKAFGPGHQAECAGKGVLPHMKVNPPHGQKRNSLSVHAICSAAQKWMHSSRGKPAMVPVNNRHTVAAVVPVPKVRMSMQPKGQQGDTSRAGQLDPSTAGQFDHADRSD